MDDASPESAARAEADNQPGEGHAPLAREYNNEPEVAGSNLRRRGAAFADVDHDDAATNLPREPEQPAAPEGKQCKICLGGEEEEAELGRLISPCKCKGSIKYVHIECLNQWRKTSQNPHSYYQCDNCKYKYNFRRTAMSSYLRSRWVIHALTLLTLVIIVWLSGYVWKLIDYCLTPDEERAWQSWWLPDFYHIVSGLSVVGLAGGLHMVTLMRGPLPLLGRGGNDNVGTFLFCIVVFIGLCRATVSIYKLVEHLSRRVLEKADDLIVEVN